MPRLTINGTKVEVDAGATVLDAARRAGANVPTLCHYEKTGPQTACMLCVVRDVAADRLVLSCALPAADGMEIVTDDPGVFAARRSALELLLNEHAGDCEGPCERICPAGLHIPLMLRTAQSGDAAGAAALAREDLVFPATLGRICSAPCERVCRRADYDAAIAIRTTHGALAEAHPPVPAPKPAPSGRTVGIVGSGLAGLAAAAVLARRGHACTVYEKAAAACPGRRALGPEKLPPEILDAEIAAVAALGVDLRCGVEICGRSGQSGRSGQGEAEEKNLSVEGLLAAHDAVIVACGLEAPAQDRVFVVPEEALAVRAVGAGKNAALLLHFLFTIGRWPCPEITAHRDTLRQRPFNSALGRLEDGEKDAYAVERLHGGAARGDTPAAEAARCLHCDCQRPVSCKLRQHAETHGLGPQLRRSLPRPAVGPVLRAGRILFEPGKCVRCGVCVALTRRPGGGPGMTFTGRGLDSRVGPTAGAALAEALGAEAEECVRACPTGALAFEDAERPA